MEEFEGAANNEIGFHLAQVRERAGMKQAELARKITWSPAVLSRVETGDRQLTEEEVQTVLEAIGTSEAVHLQEVLRRKWRALPRPALDHPDQDVLWEAEKAIRELVQFQERPDIRPALERRLSEYISEIQQIASLLLKREHQIAFIGSIGVGKSTTICRLAGLEVPSQDNGPPVPVLEAGAGGVTFCEVHLHTGPGHGLIIEPCGDGEIRGHVRDFAEHLLNGEPTEVGRGTISDSEYQGISKEVERSLRNMSGLKVRREKSNGKITRRDEGKELAQSLRSSRELIVEVMARMELYRRDRRDIWYERSSGKDPMLWLKEIFELINNGRHPDFTLPRRIEVIIPQQLLGISGLSVRIIDTKGIDRTAARADLENLLDEPHTLAILCSGFNNAPAAETRLLLERAREAGVRMLDMKVSLLVLPRPSEALAVKDESGNRVATAEEGYELKGEQVDIALESLGKFKFDVEFFNAHQDDPECLREFLLGKLGKARQVFRDRLHEITENAKVTLMNHEQEQVKEVLRAAAGMLGTWVAQNGTITPPSAHVQDSLMDQIRTAHPKTIHASVTRAGEWWNLSYSHHLGYGARRYAALTLGRTVEGFSELCRTMVGNPDYAEGKELVHQAEGVLQISYEELLRKLQLMGQTSFSDEMKQDPTFWHECENEWGKGPGYRARVASLNEAWFMVDDRQEMEKRLRSLIEREWGLALERVTALFENEE